MNDQPKTTDHVTRATASTTNGLSAFTCADFAYKFRPQRQQFQWRWWLRRWFTVGGWAARLERNCLWNGLRRLGRSPLAQATIAMPVLGYLLLLNDDVVRYYANFQTYLHQDLLQETPRLISYKLYFLYFGLSLFGITQVFFNLRCPALVRLYAEAVDYFHAEKDLVSDTKLWWMTRKAVSQEFSREMKLFVFRLGLIPESLYWVSGLYDRMFEIYGKVGKDIPKRDAVISQFIKQVLGQEDAVLEVKDGVTNFSLSNSPNYNSLFSFLRRIQDYIRELDVNGKSEVMLETYKHTNRESPGSRLIAYVGYSVAAVLIAIPTIDTFARVIGTFILNALQGQMRFF